MAVLHLKNPIILIFIYLDTADYQLLVFPGLSNAGPVGRDLQHLIHVWHRILGHFLKDEVYQLIRKFV